jgi:flagellar hook assembly protein FlgD
LQGRQIRTLQDGVLPAGHHQRSWDGMTASGSRAGNGVYLVRFSAPGVRLTKKAILVR